MYEPRCLTKLHCSITNPHEGADPGPNGGRGGYREGRVCMCGVDRGACVCTTDPQAPPSAEAYGSWVCGAATHTRGPREQVPTYCTVLRTLGRRSSCIATTPEAQAAGSRK